VNELYGQDYKHYKRILWNIREYGSPPSLLRHEDNRLNIAYLIALNMIEWEGDPMGNFVHLTEKGQRWLKDEMGRNERYRR